MSNITPRTTFKVVADDHAWIYADQSEQRGLASVTLDLSKFTKATHYPDNYIPSGVPLGKVTATGKYGPYDNAASDGRETCVGFLRYLVNDPTDANAFASLWFGVGAIQENELPVTIDTAGKADLAAWFKFF